MSENISARAQIIQKICDVGIIPVGKEMYSWEVADAIAVHLDADVIKPLADYKNSVREALETIDGYTYSNGTSSKSYRKITEKKVKDPHSPCGYYIKYKFY